MIIKIQKFLALLIMAVMFFGMIITVSAADLSGWDITYNDGCNASVSIDTEAKPGDPCMLIHNKNIRTPNVYVLVNTKVRVEQGKTYYYGLNAKAEKFPYGDSVSLQIDWTVRDSLVPFGGSYDWTKFARTFTAAATGEVNIMLVVNDPGKLWVDDVFCYEYTNGKISGGNLVTNGRFGGELSAAPINDNRPTAFDPNDLNSVVSSIKSSSTFSYNDLKNVYGGMKFIPAYPSKNITVDGKISEAEWDNYPKIKLPTLGSQHTMMHDVNIDAYGYFRFAYDDENLYILAEMYDDVFHGEKEGEIYWTCDCIQLALSKFGETFGIEITLNIGDDGTTRVYGSSLVDFKASQNADRTQSIYEAAIPWSLHFDGKPQEDVLINALYNDNDHNGRAYCIEWAPGISAGKYNTYFHHLRLMEHEDDLAWFEGPNEVEAGKDSLYSFYYVNTSKRDKNVNISIPFAGINRSVRVAAETGIHQTVILKPEEEGVAELFADITENGVSVAVVSQKTMVLPDKDRYNEDFFALMYKNAAEIDSLISQCEKKGIPTIYEQQYPYLIRQFTEDLRAIVSDPRSQISKIDYTGKCLEKIYIEARDNLTAYLSGEKEAFDAPQYVTSPLRTEGVSIIGNTRTSKGVEEERPVFFIGTADFERDDVPDFGLLGFNANQYGLGVNSIIKKVGSIGGWREEDSGSFPMTVRWTDTEAKYGEKSAFFSSQNQSSPNQYRMVRQDVTVKPNTKYTWGFSAKANNCNSVAISAQAWENRVPLDGTYDWQDFAYEFTTGPNQITAVFLMTISGVVDELYLDNVYLLERGVGENLVLNGGFEDNGYIVDDVCVDVSGLKPLTDKLDAAAKYNVSGCWLASIHYFPTFLFDLYPEMAADVSHFMRFDPMNEKARQVIELYFRAVMPILKDYPALTSICLTNEPQNIGKYPQMEPFWHKYLYDKYDGDINALNRAHKSNYSSFGEIPVSGSVDNSQKVNIAVDWDVVEEEVWTEGDIKFIQSRYSLDWNMFNDETFAAWHAFMADIIREYTPDMPIHAKLMSHDTDHAYEVSDGTNYELFSDFSDYHGNDGWEIYSSASLTRDYPDYESFHHKAIIYDQQRSIKRAPVFNSEDHITIDSDKDWSFYQAPRIYADMWQGGIHGRVASVIWQWDKSNEQQTWQYGLFSSKPDCIIKVGKANHDLNRLAYEVTAFQNAEATIGLIRSNISRAYSPNPSCFFGHSAALFAGQIVDSITDRAIENIFKYPLIIVPELTHIPEYQLSVIERYVESGGKLLVFDENSLALDDFDNPHNPERIANILKNAEIHPTPDRNTPGWFETYCTIIKNASRSSGLMKVEVINAENGEPIKKVEWMVTEYNGKLLINMVNYTYGEDKTVKILVDGKEITSSKDILNGENLGTEIFMAPYSPRLLELE